jgi:hypothetical protein
MTNHDLPKLSKNKMEAMFQQSKRHSIYFAIFPFHSLLFAFGIGEDTALQPHVGQTIGL